MVRIKYRKIFTAAAISVMSVFLVSGFSSMAIASNMPISDWVIRMVPGKGKSGLSYCSMHNSYKSGQKLIFAKDASSSSTVAIDFQKPILEVGRQYVIFIKTGQLSKQYTAIAATTNIMIMKVGTDNELYDGFVQSREVSFRLGADTLSFGFSAGIIDALNALTDCASSAAAGKVFEGKEVKVSSSETAGGLEGKKLPPAKDFRQQVAEATDEIKKETSIKEIANRSEVAEMSSNLIQNKKFKKIKVVKTPVENIEASQEPMITTTITKENPDGVEVSESREKKKFKPVGVKDSSSGEGKLLSKEDVLVEPQKEMIGKEDYARDQESRRQEISKLEETISKLKLQNKKLMKANSIIKDELQTQKIKSDTSKKIVEKTKEELLSEIRGLKQTQTDVALKDAQLQKESQEILLETQNRQKEIINEIKRLREENEKLNKAANKEQKSSKSLIAKNQAEMERLKEENRKIALQNELEEQTRKKKELESSIEQNRIRSELLKIKSENSQLAMDIESGKTDVISETGALNRQSVEFAQKTMSEIDSNKDMVSTTYDNQKKLIEETEMLKAENRRLMELTEIEKEETRRLAEESQVKQSEIEEEIARIKEHNQEMMEKLKSVKERSVAVQTANREFTSSPISLINESAKSSDNLPDEDVLKRWLYNSGAAGSSYIETDNKLKDKEKIYRWKDNSVFGYAQEVANIKSSAINKVVDDYIKHLSSNCKGDFAKTSGGVRLISSYEVLEAETACMGKKKETAAVVLFVLGNGKINIITQETAPANIEIALDNRKRIISSIE